MPSPSAAEKPMTDTAYAGSNSGMSQQAPTRFRFGLWEADIANGELFKSGRKVHLQRQPFKILATLLARAGQVVTREELREELWPGTRVEVDLSLNTAVKKLRAVLSDNPRLPHFIETVPDRGYRFLRKRLLVNPEANEDSRSREPADRAADVRLAVLPFENLNADGQDYFSDGITEHIIARCGALDNSIAVVATPFAVRYKHMSKSMPQLCRELKANYIVAGSTLRSGGQVRVDAKLIGSDQNCIWSRSYTHSEVDLLLGQDQIADDIVRSLAQALSPAATPEYITTPALDDAYRRGRHMLRQGTEPGIQEGVALFQQAIALNERFAPAYCGLATAFVSLGGLGRGAPSQTFSNARSAAERALELAPHLSEPHTALALVQYAYDWDAQAAEESCRRALLADPGSYTPYLVRALVCTASNRHSEALASLQRAREIKPCCVFIQTNLAFALYFAGRFAEALDAANDGVHLDGNVPLAHAALGCVLEQTGRTAAAVGEYQIGLRCCPDSKLLLACMGRGFALLGRQADATKIVNRLIEEYKSAWFSPYWIALVCAALGRTDETLEWLKRAFADRCGWRVLCHVDPRLKAFSDKLPLPC